MMPDTGRLVSVSVNNPRDRENTDKEIRTNAVFAAQTFWGTCPDLIEKANEIANFIIEGKVPARTSAEIHTLPKAKVQ